MRECYSSQGIAFDKEDFLKFLLLVDIATTILRRMKIFDELVRELFKE